MGSDSPGDAGDGEASLPPHCSNTQKDADETDVDCGGKDCAGCDTGKVCAVATDCASKKCNSTNKICDPPLCTDGIKNGAESDTDCGGANCPLCADTKTCNSGTDCASGVCAGAPKTCQVPNCSDNVKNGNEGDKDCGGTCPSKCSLGQSCKAAADCGSNVCTTSQCKCPAGMALVAATGGGSYCIDQLEVSYEQYETFWQAGPTFNLPACSWNTSYTPTSNWPASSFNKKKPVRNVDWCDAWAYCQWAGKRLCGKQNGGAVAYGDFASAAQSQWMNACTAGVNTYPYGSAFVAGNCVGQGYAFPDAGVGPQDVNRSANNCLGAAPGLYDMSGNVAEWEDSCNGTTGTGDDCRVRGGSYPDGSAALECKADRSLKRDAKLDDVGFRCCFP
ncbi:MAG: hypothetical protein DYH12_35730 [Sorangiineae bacterium PRO1]|nr:hypothetical protein [Sorangiineae bacterium PRO1]